MRLKKIEIHGFKSFADKTDFEVGKGVTCLVGPNGCGKSNVVDALKWSLGEQRASALRGDSMADVIFKGNGNRPAMSFAEVTLIFDNENGELPIELPEVAVTRRLLRSGDSEYLLNRQPVRLKDVRELFVDTGLGANAYAVLEQGKIDAVLRANPVDRRALFEEAAGIQRFRLRKKEAARKLEKVDQNLLRVADLMAELEKRERSLKVQAGRARSYMQLTGRLTELKTIQFLAAGAEMAARFVDLKGRLETARQDDGRTESELDAATKAVAERDSAALAARDAASELKTREAQARGERDSARQHAESLEERRDESLRVAEDRETRIGRLAEEIVARENEVAARTEEAARFAADLAAARDQAGQRKEALLAAEREEHERAGEIERLRRASLMAAQQEIELSNRLTAIDTRARGVRQSRERLVRREAEIAGMLEKVREDGARVASDLDRLGRAAEERGASLERSREELQARREREHELRIRIAELGAQRAAKVARRETLDSVIERMEGLDEGARSLLKAARTDSATLSGVRGLLGELITVPRDRARAVDAALGAFAGAIVVDSIHALRASLEFLRKENKGAATFFVLDQARAVGESSGPGESLLDGLELGSDVAPLARAVLGEVRVVESESQLLEGLGGGAFLVTKDGMRLDKSGAIQDRPKKQTLGFVERKAERDELTKELAVIERESRRLVDDETRLAGEIAEWTATVAEAERSRREVETGIVESRSASERLRDRAQIFRRELKISARERFDVEREARKNREESAAARVDLRTKQDERSRIESDRDALVAAREERLDAMQALVEAAAAATRDVVRVEERARSAQSELGVLRRGLEELARGREIVAAEREQAKERAARAADESVEQREIAERLSGELADLADEIERADGAVAAAAEATRAAREEALAAAERRETARTALHRLEMEERELELGQTNLRARAQEEISLDIDARLAEFDTNSAPPLEQVSSEVIELRDRIARLGNVNLDAITELEEVEQRLGFLLRERGDLDTARKSLEDTIRELDLISKDKFVATFEVIRGHFREIFRKLFQGGRADILLTEGADVLEAGVEIVAGPPGKDARSITLLSGGERTMTAVGLLFALFKAKPAPVAVLDEVDAALDETNTERFCGLLSEFIGQSQFIIVTHSKRTMSYADIIFGVTMQENGISKRIGIKLEDYDRKDNGGKGQVA